MNASSLADDYGCYTALTVEVEANFFPEDMSPAMRSQLIWIIFAIGQVTRPLGGAALGFMADRIGRRPAIIMCTFGMMIGTSGIGALPTMRCCGSGFGYLGIVLLCVCRLLQGLCAAGETATVFTWVAETISPRRICFGIGLCVAAGEAGFLVASGVASAIEALPDNDVLTYGWRLPFLFSLPLGLVTLLVQSKGVGESDEFQRTTDVRAAPTDGKATKSATSAAATVATNAKAVAPAPIFSSLWANYRWPFVLSVMMLGQHASAHYGTISFSKDYLVRLLAFTTGEAGGLMDCMYAVSVLLDVFASSVGDAVGLVRWAVATLTYCLLSSLPAWMLLVSHGNLGAAYAGAVLLAAGFALTHVPMISLMLGLFPTSVRSTGFGLSYNLAQLIFAAFAPNIANSLREAFAGGVPEGETSTLVDAAPAIWLYVGLLSSSAAVAGVYCALQSGTLKTVSTLREERFC